MSNLEELYYAIGRLEGLMTRSNITLSDLNFFQEIVIYNDYFKMELSEDIKEDNTSNNDNDFFYETNYAEDTFYALTDGQYGSYDEWLDADGDIDRLYDSLGY